MMIIIIIIIIIIMRSLAWNICGAYGNVYVM